MTPEVPRAPTPHRHASAPLGIATIYVLAGIAWILFTDRAAELTAPTPQALERFQSVKGALFVLLSGVLVYLLADRAMRRVRHETGRYRKLALAVERTADAVIITDTTGRIEYVNPAFEQITGYSPSEVLGKTPRFLRSGKTDPEHYITLWERLGRGERWSGTFVNQRKDGREYLAESTISPVLAADGTLTNYVGVQRDVTWERAIEERLRHAQKLELVGQLTGGIAHDFNNLLAVVQTSSELLATSLPPEAGEAGALVHDLRGAAERGRTMIRRLMAFGRKEQLRVGPTDLATTVTAISTSLKRMLPATIRLELAAAPELPHSMADAGAVEQILLNLATNARDAMADGGVLTLRLGHCVRDHDAAPEWLPKGAYVTIEASDTGIGMDESVRARIFDPFFTTKAAGEGTGLGMAMVYGLVKQQGGFVEVESAPGRGTTVRLLFREATAPIAAAQPRSETTRAPPTDTELRGTETVLVVEDDAALRDSARRALASFGYHVVVAADGEEAIEVFRAHGGAIDLVFSDLSMPRLSGLGLYHALNAGNTHIPFLMASGYPPEEAGVGPEIPYLLKPWTVRELLALVRALLGRAA